MPLVHLDYCLSPVPLNYTREIQWACVWAVGLSGIGLNIGFQNPLY